MALTKFVNNVKDLSDDGGYKFRFCCDRCGDGIDSQYISSSANVLKTALDVFSVFNPLGGFGRRASQGVDRGLRGKERDAAYEQAVNEAMSFFKKCTKCGKWVCPQNCFNDEAGLCEGCAPNAVEEGAQAAAQKRAATARTQAAQTGQGQVVLCPICGTQQKAGKFCTSCGNSMAAASVCKKCRTPLDPQAKFCGNCGERR